MKVRTIWADIIACLMYYQEGTNINVEDRQFINYFDQSSGKSLQSYVKTMDAKKRDVFLDKLIEDHDLKTKMDRLPEEIWQLMNTEQLIKLSGSKIVEIGSHGHMHYNLGDIDIEDASNDISSSKRLLEQVLNSKIDMIAYPDNSYSKEVKDIADIIGFNKQLAVDYKFEDDKNDKRILPRQGVACTTTFESNIFFINKAFQTRGF